MNKDVKNSDIERTDRVELSGYFDVHSHDSGFQLSREDRTYSIIPVTMNNGFVSQKIGWEVLEIEEAGGGKEQFEGLTEAIEYVLQEEGVKVSVYPVRDFYKLLENRGGRP